jgi:hypothetical protein
MNASKTFKSYTDAQAFYNAQQGECSIASSKKLGGWVVQYEEKAESAPMIDQVYAELKANIENNSMVCLDNVNLQKLGITEKQFSGYCSQLAQRGVYYTQADWSGWAEVK